jgi:hypothetical protein
MIIMNLIKGIFYSKGVNMKVHEILLKISEYKRDDEYDKFRDFILNLSEEDKIELRIFGEKLSKIR